MKLLYIVASLSPESGGPTKVVTELTEALVKRGIEISIFAPVEQDDIQKVVEPKGVNLRLFPQGALARWWTSYSPDLARTVRQEASKFALIHIHEIWHHPHFAAYQAAKRTGKPYIVTPHGALEPWCLNYKALKKKIYATLIQRRILKEAAALHALTNEEVKNIRAFGVDNVIAMIPNGINPGEFQSLPPDCELRQLCPSLSGKQVVLFLSRIHPKKGLDLLAKAFGQVAKERDNVRLVIAGPDNEGYQARVEQMLRANGVRNKTIFTGMLIGQEKLAALSRTDVFVLPSYSEGFSIAILEAMICGLPVIITHPCNFPEVAEAEAGIVIDPDPEQLAEALTMLLDNPQLREEMGANGRRLVSEKFTWDKIAGQMIEIYEEVLKQNR